MQQTDKPIEAEVISQPQSQALTVRSNQAVGQALGVDDIIAQVALIQNVMHKVMKEGEHYGKIPGCGDKATLLQPGAQKLTMTFRLCPSYEIQEVNIDRGHKEYRVICTLRSMGTNSFVAQGVGCCSTMESKYRWRTSARRCPKCGKENIRKSKQGDGWYCWQKTGGCGTNFPADNAAITSQAEGRIEHDNPADFYNTVLKIAKKRSYVDATITATAASDIFTQDIGDDETDPETGSAAPGAPAAASQPQSTSRPSEKPATAAQPLKQDRPKPTEEWRTIMMNRLEANPGQPGRNLVDQYFHNLSNPTPLMPNEPLEHLELRFIPADAAELMSLVQKIDRFRDGDRPEHAFPPHFDPLEPTPAGTTTPAKVLPKVLDEAKAKAQDPEWWRGIIVPVPPKGMKRAEYMKKPQTIGQLFDMRHGNDDESQAARQRLWGFVNNYQPTGWDKRDGTHMPPSDADVKFRDALDAFADWFEKNHPGEKL